MTCKIKVSVLLLFLPLFFGACMNLKQPRNKVDFCTLEYDPPRIARFSPLPYVIRLARFNVAPIYNSNKIIYRNQSFKRNAYFYYKWQANPRDLVTHFIHRDMRQSGLFRAVLPHDSMLLPSHVLEGTVDEFFESDMDESWKAVLSVSITFTAQKGSDVSNGVLFQKAYHVTKPCNQKRPEALAEAMSQAMAVLSRQITEDIYSCLEDRSESLQ